MLIIGLTGSIGMGKSTAANRFEANGIAVCDVDAIVHQLYKAPDGAAITLVEGAFPGTTGPTGVDRDKLSAALMRDPSGFDRLEALVHPLVRQAEKSFLATQWEAGAVMVVLEIPLLYETGAQALVDVVVVVSAPVAVQRERVLARAGMSEAKLEQLLARQMPDREKRARANFIIDTSGDISDSQAQVDKIITDLSLEQGISYKKHWQ